MNPWVVARILLASQGSPTNGAWAMWLFGSKVERLAKRGQFAELITLLGHSDVSLADRAADALLSLKDDPRMSQAAIGFDRAVENEVSRRRAISILNALDDAHLIDALHKLKPQSALHVLAALDPDRRSVVLFDLIGARPLPPWVIRELGRLKDPRAIDPLVQAYVEVEAWRRSGPADAIAEIGDPRAIEPLKQAIAGEDPTRHLCALGALGRLGDAWATDQLTEIMCTATPMPSEGITRDQWLRLQEIEGWARRDAAKELRKIGTPQALDGFIRYWRSPAVGATELAAEASAGLRDLADKRVTDEILALFDGGLQPAWMIETLGKLGDRRAIEPLTRLLAKLRFWRAVDNTPGRVRDRGGSKRGSVEESLAEATLLGLIAAIGGPSLDRVPEAEMLCCVCGTSFFAKTTDDGRVISGGARVGTMHVETGAMFCTDHAEMKDSLEAKEFASCSSCNFKYPTTQALFVRVAETICPACRGSLGAADSPPSRP